ncbi:hypothetical protein G7054_g1889 [Neopestalotiopsis clavispora]|nr:hypothetical protein G7054_g1889 [Neopestalotiopsis clavispora]
MQRNDLLTHLPPKVYAHIISSLENATRKRLRLACIALRDRTPLRLDRVFLSANARNVEVFRAIADHDVFRRGVTEIIWDDACLTDHVKRAGDDQMDDDLYNDVEGITEDEACPSGADDGDLPQHLERDKQIEAQLPPEVSYAYYQGLLLQQQNFLTSQADANALKYGITRFPALRRITITPTAHGVLYSPLYETPMIRAFPYGLNYPIPRGWPTTRLGYSPPYDAPPWDDEDQKIMWRGVSIVLNALAKQDHNVSEFVVDVHGLCTGLNPHMFDDETHEEYWNLVALVRKPSFTRLDLALLIASQQDDGWPTFRNGHLRGVLGEARSLQHVSLCTDLGPGQEFDIAEDDDQQIRLQTIYPINTWQDLKHLGLRGFVVRQDDLMSFLTTLPPSLRSLDLSFLRFYGTGNYRSLICEMRDRLGWRDRPVDERPVVVIGVESWLETLVGRAIWLQDEISHFLYDHGPNPFGSGNEPSPNRVQLGYGIERDEFDPIHERPWVDYDELARLGYYPSG